MSKQICFILDWYPTETNNGCVFAKHLICAVADMGYECIVIAPRNVSKATFQRDNRVSYMREEYTEKGSKIRIYMPYYFHLTSHKATMRFSMNNHYRAVLHTIQKEGLKPDVVYGHFLYQCGLTASRIGSKLGIPAFCACGENSLRLQNGIKPYDTGLKYCDWKQIINNLSGIISVSTNNKNLLISNGFVDPSMRMKVIPNGVDYTLFHPMNKAECREQLGFPQNAFIIAYTGAFTINKGIDRLNAALKKCDNVYSIFMGEGAVQPDCDNILLAKRVNNIEVAKYLNAADIFVLPTKGEGCCNAIVEALACGLPVISSNLAFNDDLLNSDNSIRINVESVDEISDAIITLRDNTSLRDRLAENARKDGQRLNIQLRAKRILDFMGI